MEYSDKYKKYLSNCYWYHATTLDNWHKIKKLGIKADYNRETSSDLDFGYGFYLTNKSAVAENFVTKLKKAGVLQSDDILIVIEFNFSPLDWFTNKTYNTCIFEHHNDEFALFVYENRMNNINGDGQHKYDAIFGVMSDSKPIKTILQHKMGKLTKQQVLDAFKKTMSNKQLSLHNQKLCDIIKLSRVYTFEENCKSEIIRKELNLDDSY